MRTYFKRLKNHPGVPVATILSIAFFLMGLPDINSALFGLVASGIVWVPVLLTAINQPLPRDYEN